jgi:two-component system alkaline phosphatase synthesis response regulator PhoP
LKFHILIAEDEENLANTLSLNLELEGYEVTLCRSGTQALEIFRSRNGEFDLALLDVMLPGTNGFDLCSTFRVHKPRLPVIFLTAKSQSAEKREGLKLGADDYITKPFDLEELLLRVNNLIRRSAKEVPSKFVFEGGQVDFSTYEVTDRNGNKSTLAKREIGLLQLLTSNPGKVTSRDQIISTLWEPQENASSRTIDNYILGFRKLFEENPKEPRHFYSVRGVGYRFVPWPSKES